MDTAPKLLRSVGQIRQGSWWLKPSTTCDSCYREGTKSQGAEEEGVNMRKQGRLPGEGDIRARTNQKDRISTGKHGRKSVWVQVEETVLSCPLWLQIKVLADEVSGDSSWVLACTPKLTSPVVDQPPVSMSTPTGTPRSTHDNLPLHPVVSFPFPPSVCPQPSAHLPDFIPNWQQE